MEPRSGRVRDGDLLWTPSPEVVDRANITAFTRWLKRDRGLEFGGYAELWHWSVTDLDGFWQALWDFCGIRASARPAAVLGSRTMPGARWFPGARLNYAENVLAQARPGTDALYSRSETRPLAALSWDALAGSVRALAGWLRSAGVAPGDRVASWLPNIPQTVIAMLATTSIGAVWTSCSPDFGWRGTLDRFRQISPKVLFCTDGYQYGGRHHDRREQIAAVIAGLPGLSEVVAVPGPTGSLVAGAVPWSAAVSSPAAVSSATRDFAFEQVPFDHPLWILFSSGTTGPPKAITHSHGGILVEQLKLQRLHLDLRAGDRLFFYTTTGWMMWNFLVSSLLLGVRPLLYDGAPAWPTPDALWAIAAEAEVTFFGASPAFVAMQSRAGVVPRDSWKLPALRSVMLAGSPVSAECGAWFYRNLSPDVWICPGSGGTDICSGFVGGIITQPVYAGELQARHLGVAAYAYSPSGTPLTGEVGEMVITEPLPSMPVRLWNDPDGTLYRDTYFGTFPGVWRQGDFFLVNERGGCFVLGRSDATLNRHGVRIGTAEIYAALEAVPEVADALIVNLDLPGGGFFMPLFVTLLAGTTLDEELSSRIRDALRTAYTPRHVPDAIIEVPAIPVTLTGKKMEVPVREILLGTPPGRAANPDSMANPDSLDAFVSYARTQRDYRIPASTGRACHSGPAGRDATRLPRPAGSRHAGRAR